MVPVCVYIQIECICVLRNRMQTKRSIWYKEILYLGDVHPSSKYKHAHLVQIEVILPLNKQRHANTRNTHVLPSPIHLTHAYTGLTHMCTNWFLFLSSQVVLYRLDIYQDLRDFDYIDAFTRKRVKEYLRLGVPGLFSMSEWWYWEIASFTAGRFGICLV